MEDISTVFPKKKVFEENLNGKITHLMTEPLNSVIERFRIMEARRMKKLYRNKADDDDEGTRISRHKDACNGEFLTFFLSATMCKTCFGS